MKNSSLRALIGHLKTKGASPELTNTVFSELYNRIQEDLKMYCRFICNKSPFTRGEGLEDDILQEALLLFYLNIHKFNEYERSEYSDEKTLRKALLNYIGTIIFRNWIDKMKKLKEIYNIKKLANHNRNLEIKGIINKNVSSENTRNIKFERVKGYFKIDSLLFTKIIQNLKPREFDILITYIEYFPDKQPKRSDIERLARTYNISHDYLRIIKHRTFKTIKKKLGLT